MSVVQVYDPAHPDQARNGHRRRWGMSIAEADAEASYEAPPVGIASRKDGRADERNRRPHRRHARPHRNRRATGSGLRSR